MRIENILTKKCIVAVSGGADSMCLLHKVMTINKDNIAVVHVNHNLRGEESKRDEDFVREYCLSNKIKFYCKQVDVKSHIKEFKLSLEESARILRYEALETVKKIEDAEYILLAHNKNDDVETFLHNLFRGSGIKGLCGIKKVNGSIVRPIIDMSRSDIEEYNKIHNVPFIIDSSNLSTDFTRNKIRQLIIPMIEKEINSSATNNIANAMQFIRMQDDIVSTKIDSLKYNIIVDKGDVIINLSDINDFYIATELIKKGIEAIIGLKDISYVHINDVYNLLKTNSPKSINLPKGLYAKRVKNGIKFTQNNNKFSLRLQDVNIPYNLNDKIVLDINEYHKKDIILCYDKLKNAILRNRCDGDYLYIDKFADKKIKLKDYFIKNKVNIFDRDDKMLIALENRIVYIEDMFIDSEFLYAGIGNKIVIREIFNYGKV